MTGRPQRELPKETIRLSLNEHVQASLRPLMKNEIVWFASLSQLIETILFLSEHIYIVEPDDGFVLSLARVRADQLIAQVKNPELYGSHFVHVTLDAQTIRFVDMLIGKYPMLFKRRSDTIELLLWNIGRECSTPKDVKYYASRLAEVLTMHPTRIDRRRKNDA